MIATVAGTLADRGSETVLVQTDGGVGYAVTVPIGVFGRLPAEGARVLLYTELVVKEDGWALFGFDQPGERTVFQRLLSASGFGPKLALATLSALGPERTVRSIRERDLAALSSVTGIGRKKAERLVLELQDRFTDFALNPAMPRSVAGDDAIRALVALGYPLGAADDAVRAGLASAPGDDTAGLVRRALQLLAASRAGR